MGPIDFEIAVWVLISLMYCVGSWLEVRDTRGDWTYLVTHGINGRRRAIARMHVRIATKRLVTSASFVLIGVGSWLANHAVSSSAFFGFVFSAAMFLVLIWAFVVQIADRREKTRLMRNLEEH